MRGEAGGGSIIAANDETRPTLRLHGGNKTRTISATIRKDPCTWTVAASADGRSFEVISIRLSRSLVFMIDQAAGLLLT